MSSVEFDEDKLSSGKQEPHILYGKFEPGVQAPSMVKFLMRHGIKTEKAANTILLSVVIIAIILFVFVYIYFVEGAAPKARPFNSFQFGLHDTPLSKLS